MIVEWGSCRLRAHRLISSCLSSLSSSSLSSSSSSSCSYHRTVVEYQKRTNSTGLTGTSTIDKDNTEFINCDQKSFRRHRENMAQKLLIEYDQIAFGGLLLQQHQQQQQQHQQQQQQQQQQLPPSVTIQWSNRLRTTAGRAHLILQSLQHKDKFRSKKKPREEKRLQMELHQQPLVMNQQPIEYQTTSKQRRLWVTDDRINKNTLQHSQNIVVPEQQLSLTRRTAIIELSTKVVDDVSRLQTTMLHELCHVAAWIVDGNTKPPHGPYFQKWAQIATTALPSIQVTTKHRFQINYKYSWECYNPSCNVTVIRRHNRRSIDVKKHVCGKCHGLLREVIVQQPSPGRIENSMDGSRNAEIPMSSIAELRKPCQPIRRPLSEYHRFIKKNIKIVTKQLQLQQKEGRERKARMTTTTTTNTKSRVKNNNNNTSNRRRNKTISPQKVMKECAKLWQQEKKDKQKQE